MVFIKRKNEINSLESEAGIIASIIHHPEFTYYSEQLKPNHFTNEDNRYVYHAIVALAEKGIKNVDAYNIIEVLNSSDATRKYADALSVEKLNELVMYSDCIARHSVEEYKILVKNVMDAAFRRDLLSQLEECEVLCTGNSPDNLEQMIYGLIDGVMTEYSLAKDDIPEMKEVVDGLWEEIVSHQDGKSGGIPFIFPTLNEYVTLEPSEVVCIGASAKSGKSMFMMNEAVDVLKRGKSVMYIDSELSSRLFLCRMLSHLTGIDFRRIKTGKYDEFEAKKIQAQIDWIKKQKFVHIYMPIFDQQTIYTAVKKINHKFDPLDVVIVDYLKGGDSTDAYQVYSELGNITNLLKNVICGDMGIAGLAAAQLTASGKLADSAKIARNASTIVMMVDKTPEEIEEDGEECGNKKLIVTQNRNGMQHVTGEYIDIQFDGNTCTLTEAKQHIPTEPY